jgi:hypothetical protein
MKKNLLKSLAMFGLAGMLFTACQKDDDVQTQSITEEEAAEVAARSVDPASGGVVVQLNTSVTIATNPVYTAPSNCGVQKSNTYSGSSSQGASISYAYSYGWNWMLTCSGTTPQRFDYSYSGQSGYDGPRVTTAGSASASATIAGLESSASQYSVSSNYTHDGTTTSKIGNKNSFTSKVVINSTNIKIDKVTRQIVSGTGAIEISGATTAGATFNYAGTITFIGNNKANIVLNSNQAYSVQW